MSAFTKDEALAFIDAMRLNLRGRTGFKWFVDRLSHLSEYVESTASENAQLNGFVDSIGARADFEEYRRATQDSVPAKPADGADEP